MFCCLQAPANHSHLRNWDTKPCDAQVFAPRAILMIKVTAWLLIRDHQANFSLFSPFFNFFLHLCFLGFFNGNGVYQHWSSRVHLYGVWSLAFICGVCILEIFIPDIIYVMRCSIILIISIYQGRISLSRCVSSLDLANPSFPS